MRYIVEVSNKTAKKIGDLIDQGKYESFHDFLLVAVENQLFIESHELGVERKSEPIKVPARIGIDQEEPTKVSLDLPGLQTDWGSLKFVEPPNLDSLWSRYIWGQYNRIFPAKITLRVLANSLENREWMDLEVLQDKASDIAVKVGPYLRRVDRKEGRKRWENLSVGLPRSARNQGAISRFKLQFVGYKTKQGVLHGLPASLGFVHINSGDSSRQDKIGITEAGAQFAELENPIMDSDSLERTLSDDEVAFYISHIQSNQQYEMAMIKKVVRAVKDEHTSSGALKSQIATLNDQSWSVSILGTMCTGVLSRMRELRIIQMRREGLKSRYMLGPNAKMVKTE